MSRLLFDFLIFSDASFDSDSSVGTGATLTLTKSDWQNWPGAMDLPIRTRIFREKNIARLELITALWALEDFERECKASLAIPPSLCLITDSKTITELSRRRHKLEANEFQSKRTLGTLTNADLYRKFFESCDKLQPTIRWIKGHGPSRARGNIELIFAQVDRGARQTLRRYLKGRLPNAEIKGALHQEKLAMVTSQTIWVLQWDRYTSMAKSQDAPDEFWTEYHKIALPSDGQVTETEIAKLKELMARFKLEL